LLGGGLLPEVLPAKSGKIEGEPIR